MSCWELLGLAPTGDIQAIKKAFAEQSRLRHPEDDPEGFKRLREAFLQAKKLAPLFELYEDVRQMPAPVDMDKNSMQTEDSDSLTAESSDMYCRNTSDQDTVIEARTAQSYDFSATQKFEIPDDQYFKNNRINLNTEFRKKEKGRRRVRFIIRVLLSRGLLQVAVGIVIFVVLLVVMKKTGLFRGVEPADSGYVSMIPLGIDISYQNRDALKNQAMTILESQKEYRQDTLESLRQGEPYSLCPSAAKLHINENDYSKMIDDFKNIGLHAVSEVLDTYRQDEIAFIRLKIFPIIKQGLINNKAFILAVEEGTMVGMTYSDCFYLMAQYMQDHDEALLDQRLLTYTRLVSPDQWGLDAAAP